MFQSYGCYVHAIAFSKKEQCYKCNNQSNYYNVCLYSCKLCGRILQKNFKPYCQQCQCCINCNKVTSYPRPFEDCMFCKQSRFTKDKTMPSSMTNSRIKHLFTTAAMHRNRQSSMHTFVKNELFEGKLVNMILSFMTTTTKDDDYVKPIP